MPTQSDLLRAKAWMLGPKAENAERFEQLLVEGFRDYCYWRRNFHPEDEPYVRAADQLDAGFQEYYERLRDRYFELLSNLKRSVPFFSARYLGHMNTDLLMPGVLGYVAGMLYNQNNIVEEASTITMQFERESVQAIARMLFLPDSAWGHLCSGGTTANIEALWAARNLRLLPYQMGVLARSDGAAGEVVGSLEVGERGKFKEFLGRGGLSSITIPEILGLQRGLSERCARDPGIAATVQAHSVSELGLAGLAERARAVLGDGFPRSFRVIVSTNAHYSIRKALGVIGLGEAHIRSLPLDRQLRMDVRGLREIIAGIHGAGEAVLAVVGVYGSTEEGAIDDFSQIVQVREELRARGEGDFWLHGDACYGGYALALAHRADSPGAENIPRAAEELRETMRVVLTETWHRRSGADAAVPVEEVLWSPSQAEYWLSSSRALAEADSIAIDPHKWGYIPYPAGAILYRDSAVRDFVRYDAPYLNASPSTAAGSQWDSPYVGKYTLEGSRPGAYGAATWLAHTSVPLDRSGHGLLIGQSILGARYLKHVLEMELDGTGESQIRCHFPYEPDLNILCYTFSAEYDGEPVPVAIMNRVIERLYSELLPTESNPTQKIDFVIAKTELACEQYGDVLQQVFSEIGTGDRGRILPATHPGFNPWRDSRELALIRTVVLGPFLLGAQTRAKRSENVEDLAVCYARALKERIGRLIRAVWAAPLPENERANLSAPVLFLDDDPATVRSLRQHATDHAFGRGVVYTATSLAEAMQITETYGVKAAVVDVHLNGESGLDYLKWASGRAEFRGAVVFTALEDTATKEQINAIARAGGRVTIHYRSKPQFFTGEKERELVSANRVMSDLWAIAEAHE